MRNGLLGDECARRVLALFGPDGLAWLRRLPVTLAELEARWELGQVGEPFGGARVSFVAPVADRRGRPLVLKIVPGAGWARAEHAALTHWAGRGCVRAIAFDAARGAILEERADPGGTLRDAPLDDRAATHVFAEVATTLRAAGAAASGLPTIETTIEHWLASLERSPAPTGRPEVEAHAVAALPLARALLASTDGRIVLHGDLHHGNILRRHSGGWVAIDPKGIFGPAEIEPAAFLRNPRRRLLEHPDPEALVVERTLAVSARLGYRPARVAGWGYVLGVLAAVWAEEDAEGTDDVDRWLRCAAILENAYRTVSAA